MREGIYISAVVFVLIAGWTDWRSRRIPNWLTVSGFVAGLAGNTLWLGLNGTWMALAGAGLMLGLLLPVVLLRGLGAGDWKLMGALGAFFGAKRVVLVLFFAIMIAGIMALVQMIRHKQVNRTLQNTWELLQGFFIYGIRPNPAVSLDSPGLLKLPFGIAVTVATVAYFCLARNG